MTRILPLTQVTSQVYLLENLRRENHQVTQMKRTGGAVQAASVQGGARSGGPQNSCMLVWLLKARRHWMGRRRAR